ncbi:MAG: GNAT family N-acetyltransferase, partial [Phycisphaerae bacterium]|nr:GNAT family N-acetyltransferase [Phycisphaerae bacterium]
TFSKPMRSSSASMPSTRASTDGAISESSAGPPACPCSVGTITSWYHRSYRRRRWGRIHWVAIIPDHRGRGLSKAIMTVAMKRLRKLGHRRAMLATATPCIPAIKTYLDFGFVPDLSRKGAWRAWRLVGKHIAHPVLAGL